VTYPSKKGKAAWRKPHRRNQGEIEQVGGFQREEKTKEESSKKGGGKTSNYKKIVVWGSDGVEGLKGQTAQWSS